MSKWNRVQGDVNDTLTVTLAGLVDLSAATSAKGFVALGGQTTAELSVTIPSPSGLTLLVQLSPWLEDAVAGNWTAEWEVTFADASVLTWPDAGLDVIHVRDQQGSA
jgi:hypothetical protein